MHPHATKCLLPLVVWLASCAARASPIIMPAPDRSWALQVPGEDWILNRTSRLPDGTQNYFYYSNAKEKAYLSVFIEPALKCNTASSCRDLVAGNLGRSNPEGTVSDTDNFDHQPFSVLKWLLTLPQITQDKPEFNYSAETVYKGYWIDMHLSRFPASHDNSDNLVLTAILDGVKFVEGVPADLPSPPVEMAHSSFPMGSEHHIALAYPDKWHSVYKPIDEAKGVTLRMQPSYSDGFVLQFTGFTNPHPVSREKAMQQLRSTMDVAKPMLDASAVKPDTLHELQGNNGFQTLYFEDEDKTWTKGGSGYHYVLQGFSGNGDITINFSLLFNDSNLAEKSLILDVIKSVHYE